MPVHEEIVELLREGHSPAAIAKRIGISHSDAVQHLFAEVYRGRLSRSDILLAISDQVAGEIEHLLAHRNIRDRWTLQRVLREEKTNLEIDDALLYYDLRQAPLDSSSELHFLDAPSLGILRSLIQQGESIMSTLDILKTEIEALKASVSSVATSVEGAATRVQQIMGVLESAPTKAEIEAMAADLENNVKRPLLVAKMALDAIAPSPAVTTEPPPAIPAEPPQAPPPEQQASAAM
ncbi:MAG: hypothetical protein LLG20_06795 [Acidobacteriales bacterium]|nr:hypothetical protein [Terriglobales bacterium]